MLDIYKRLVTDPQAAWHHIAALNPPPFSAIHPFCTAGLLMAALGPGIGFTVRQGVKMGVGQFLLHLLVHVVALIVLIYSVRKEAAVHREAEFKPPMGESIIAGGAMASPVWAFSLLLFLPVPYSDWLMLMMGIGMTVFYYNFASKSILAVPDIEVSKSRLRVLIPFALAVLFGHLICNWVAGSPIYVR